MWLHLKFLLKNMKSLSISLPLFKGEEGNSKKLPSNYFNLKIFSQMLVQKIRQHQKE